MDELAKVNVNGKEYHLKDETARQGSGGNADYTVYGLPVLYLTGDTTGMSKENEVSLDYVYGERSGDCTLKLQGSSSLFYPKKNYTIKFDNAFEAVEGWGEQKKYCLKANYIDHSHARNVVSAKLWGQIVRKRAYFPAAENLFDISMITGTPSTWEGATTFDENGVLTPGSSTSQSGYNPFNGIIFPAGTYNIRLEVCVTDLNMFKPFAFGFSPPSSVSSESFAEKIVSKDAFPQITEANTWGTYEYSLTIDQTAGFFLQPGENPSYYRFRNIEITNSEGGSGVPDPQQLLELPNGGAIDGFPIVIMLNDKFHGLYTFNIPKDGWLFGMGNGSQEAVLCADYSPASWFNSEITLNDDFDLEYVSDENNSDWVLPSVNRLINAVINSDGTDIDTTIAQYLDLQSAIDYLLFVAVICGGDMCGKNYLLCTYDGVKWFFSAYDMDNVYGLDGAGDTFISANSHPLILGWGHRLFDIIGANKKDTIKARYAELRETVFSEDNVALAFENFVRTIPTPLLNEDVKRWPTIPSSSVNNVSQIRDWYRRRIAIIDKKVEEL